KLQNNYRNSSYRYDKQLKVEKILEERILTELEELTPNILNELIDNLYKELDKKPPKKKKN
ncbi:unnamed protein product, partial [marine sediment metagenome]